MKLKIAIVDIGCANIGAVAYMLRRVADRVRMAITAEHIVGADRIVLPVQCGAMLTRPLLLGCIVAGILAGCGGYTDTQWMKVNESYTTEEFRRDHKACSKGIALDEACMRAKGWVDLKPSARDRAADSPQPGPAPQDYRYRR